MKSQKYKNNIYITKNINDMNAILYRSNITNHMNNRIITIMSIYIGINININNNGTIDTSMNNDINDMNI